MNYRLVLTILYLLNYVQSDILKLMEHFDRPCSAKLTCPLMEICKKSLCKCENSFYRNPFQGGKCVLNDLNDISKNKFLKLNFSDAAVYDRPCIAAEVGSLRDRRHVHPHSESRQGSCPDAEICVHHSDRGEDLCQCGSQSADSSHSHMVRDVKRGGICVDQTVAERISNLSVEIVSNDVLSLPVETDSVFNLFCKVLYNGSKLDPASGRILWTLNKGPENVSKGLAESFSSLEIPASRFTRSGLYEFGVRFEFNRLIRTATKMIRVFNKNNKAPVVVIKHEAIVQLQSPFNQMVLLDGSKVEDDFTPLDQLTFQWFKLPGSPAAGSFLNQSEAKSTALLGNMIAGQYQIGVNVTDGDGQTTSISMNLSFKAEAQLSQRQLVQFQWERDYLDVDQALLNSFIHELREVLIEDLDLSSAASLTIRPEHIIDDLIHGGSVLIVRIQGVDSQSVVKALRVRLKHQHEVLHGIRIPRVDLFVCDLHCGVHGVCNRHSKKCQCANGWLNIWFKPDNPCDWNFVITTVVLCSVIGSALIMFLIVKRIVEKCQARNAPKRYATLSDVDLDHLILRHPDSTNVRYGSTNRARKKQKKKKTVKDVSSDDDDEEENVVFTRPVKVE